MMLCYSQRKYIYASKMSAANLVQAARVIDLYVNPGKSKFMCLK